MVNRGDVLAMFVIRLRPTIIGDTLSIDLPVSKPREYAEWEVSSDYDSVRESVTALMQSSSTPYGHLIPPICTPFDLTAILYSPDWMQYRPTIGMGEKLIVVPETVSGAET